MVFGENLISVKNMVFGGYMVFGKNIVFGENIVYSENLGYGKICFFFLIKKNGCWWKHSIWQKT